MTIQLRRMSGKAFNGWVREERFGKFLQYDKIIHEANSGNLTVEFNLGPGEYTIFERWYHKTKKQTLIVE